MDQEEQAWEILTPISERKVTDALWGMGATAVGLDKVEVKDLLHWHQPTLAGYLNLILALEELPKILTTARVVFLQKQETREPAATHTERLGAWKSPVEIKSYLDLLYEHLGVQGISDEVTLLGSSSKLGAADRCHQ
ncbi:hypothetical protein AMELA_G00274190 [Ameiurus melas]|uniref:Uncharacterized protein n=1 Tax=Ameiurus melas TaxID=219545 RepID=A0A7J5ZLZ8_AMEME|nr:hypothetical protein AMELA_G00274190 [Ameiurus melas]